jgi:hypothetical protein
VRRKRLAHHPGGALDVHDLVRGQGGEARVTHSPFRLQSVLYWARVCSERNAQQPMVM